LGVAAIDGQALDHVAVVVIRWFGGILLGSGGLIRAYGGTAALCLRAAEKVEFVAEITATMQCGFSDLALVKARLLARPGLRITGETFGADGAELTLVLPEADAETVARMVADMTSGRSGLRLAD
jgi:putative IMPACT (imprinted ancient) family translation regulator